MNTPMNIEYTTEDGYKVVISSPEQIVVTQGIPCVDGGKIRHDGKMVRLMVRYDNRPELAAQITRWQADWKAYQDYKAAEFARNVPGLDELEKAQDAAYKEQARYDAAFEHMMESGDSISPKALDETLEKIASALAIQYPRAAMYLRANSYTYASNHHKYGAGKRAMELIANGGSLEEAEKILKNWLPEESIWN